MPGEQGSDHVVGPGPDREKKTEVHSPGGEGGGGFPSSTFRKRVTYTLHRPPGRPSTDNDRRPTAHDATTVAGARGGRESAADAATLEPERGSSD